MFKIKQKNDHGQDDEGYNEVLLEHANHPSHKGEIKGAKYVCHSKNDSCGDEITLYLNMKKGKVSEASWTGKGCAIAKAAADILCCTLLKENSDNVYLDEIAQRMPGRVKCVETAFNTLMDLPPIVAMKIVAQIGM